MKITPDELMELAQSIFADELCKVETLQKNNAQFCKRTGELETENDRLNSLVEELDVSLSDSKEKDKMIEDLKKSLEVYAEKISKKDNIIRENIKAKEAAVNECDKFKDAYDKILQDYAQEKMWRMESNEKISMVAAERDCFLEARNELAMMIDKFARLVGMSLDDFLDHYMDGAVVVEKERYDKLISNSERLKNGYFVSNDDVDDCSMWEDTEKEAVKDILRKVEVLEELSGKSLTEHVKEWRKRKFDEKD